MTFPWLNAEKLVPKNGPKSDFTGLELRGLSLFQMNSYDGNVL